MFPQGGKETDLSNFTFPSSLQNTETRYFVLCLRYPVCVNLQRFYDTRLRQFTEIISYDTPFASIYRDFTVPVCVNLQRLYGTPFASIYRDSTVPRLRQFKEILRYPVCVNLQRFYDTPFASIYRDFMIPCLC